MFLNPLKNITLCSKVCSVFRQTRSLRPQIKISKEQFQISLDVSSFKKDELCVKAVPEYVVIEGKLERRTKQGQVIRCFVRKFRLPEGCNPLRMKSELSSDGILTIKATRKTHDANIPCETVIPITYSGPSKNQNESLIPVKDSNAITTNSGQTKK